MKTAELSGLASRIALRLLTLATGLWHNELIGHPGRELAAYGLSTSRSAVC